MKLSQKLTKEQIDPFFQKWENMAPGIFELHKQRDAGAAELMRNGLVLYQDLLIHCHEEGQKQIIPLNGEERLDFIVRNPGKFAAFRQLDELFSEMKKMIAAKRVQLNRLNHQE